MIVASAIRRGEKVWSLPRPGRHDGVMWKMMAEGEPIPYRRDVYEQGFLTSTGAFVGRAEAARIAFAAGQLKYGLTHKPRELFSEDVW